MGKYNYLCDTLENFLSKHLIYHEQKNILYVPLQVIEDLNLLENEFDFAMNYFKEQGISVIGNSPALYSDYENYYYVYDIDEILKVDSFSMEEKRKYVIDYQKNHQIEDRNKIVEAHLHLMKCIANHYSEMSGVDVGDLISASFISFIKSIDHVNPSVNFTNYFRTVIVGAIIDEIKEIKGFPTGDFHELYHSRDKVKQKYEGETSYDEYHHIDEILHYITNDSNREKIAFLYAESIDSYSEDEQVSHDVIEEEIIPNIYVSEARKLLVQSFSALTKNQQKVLQEIFYEDKRLTEIAKQNNITTSAVENSKKSALKKLSKNERLCQFYCQ